MSGLSNPEASHPGTNSGKDTIVAISTPSGRGGIGVVRLSGPLAVPIAKEILHLRRPLAHARATLADILGPASPIGEAPPGPENATRLDEAVVTWFQAPHSYTREDVVEISAHGAPVILDFVVRACLLQGARLARPGEFTERAFLSGRLDLTQAEAVRDLIDAQTLYQARIAAEQMEGSLSRRIRPVKQSLIHLIAELEAGIDFAEDDIDLLPQRAIGERMESILAPLQALADSFSFGRLVREGLTLSIVGRPNAGKSSLFNRLIQRDRAIVTATPGTTRDPVAERVSLGGIPVELIDTAGLREAVEEAESIGIQKTREVLAEADVALLVLDATAELLTHEEAKVLEQIQGRPAIVVLNKIDLRPGAIVAHARGWTHSLVPVETSALTGEGMATLQQKILGWIGADRVEAHGGLLTNLRQQQTVLQATAALRNAQSAVAANLPHEMILLDCYAALRSLDALTGTTTTDDILNLVFSTFCIGK